MDRNRYAFTYPSICVVGKMFSSNWANRGMLEGATTAETEYMWTSSWVEYCLSK
jgi:hypothetical protein